MPSSGLYSAVRNFSAAILGATLCIYRSYSPVIRVLNYHTFCGWSRTSTLSLYQVRAEPCRKRAAQTTRSSLYSWPQYWFTLNHLRRLRSHLSNSSVSSSLSYAFGSGTLGGFTLSCCSILRPTCQSIIRQYLLWIAARCLVG